MIFSRWRKILASLLVATTLLVTSCSATEPSRFDQAQQDSTQRGAPPAVVKNATQGSSFNRYFPSDGGGYQRVYTQEKKGFAEAKLKRGGKDVAVLSISDTSSVPSAAQKYQNSSQRIAGYPAVDIGSNGTGVLVGPYQVKVQSRDSSFTRSDRAAWLQKFDLNGLARLK